MGQESICIAGDTGDVGLIPGSGISPGGENDNPMDSKSWWGPWGRKELDMIEVTHAHTHIFFIILFTFIEPWWIHSASSLIASVSRTVLNPW